MDDHTKSELNRTITHTLNALGRSCAKNIQALELAWGPSPFQWLTQLETDLDLAWQAYTRLVKAGPTGTAIDAAEAPDPAKVTTALEQILTHAFCMQLVSRGIQGKVSFVRGQN